MGRARQPSEVTCAAPNYLPVRQITTLLVPQSHGRQDLMTCLKFLIRMSKKSRRIGEGIQTKFWCEQDIFIPPKLGEGQTA